MAIIKDDLLNVRQRKYLAKDFSSLRSQLLEYARLYYPDRLRDFSEASLGGLFLDMAAYVGDTMSFYLDHQYTELNPETAVETSNIQKHLNTSGVPIVGASPALVAVNIYIQVPATNVNNTVIPDPDTLPIVQMNSIYTADNGVEFIQLEDIDFAKTRSDGNLYASCKIATRSAQGVPTSFIMMLSALCISGKETTDSFSIDSTFVPFRQLTLTQPNVSEIISVIDAYGNTYYEVNALSHDVVYQNVNNVSGDNELVQSSIKVIPAPYRYTKRTDLATRKTMLTFGGGTANTLEDDVIPDPSEFAISFPYSKTFSRVSINPQQMLQTKTLGVATVSTTLDITYRYGGGLQHSVAANSVKNVKLLNMFFPGNPKPSTAANVRNSIEVSNPKQASGGEDAPTVDELKALIPMVKNSQDRIVSSQDLLARVYAIPSNFGRVFRAAVRPNVNNPLAAQLFILSRDNQQKLITSPDTLKQNLVKYLSPYRLISDAIDILDAPIVNLTLQFEVVIDPSLNRNVVLQAVLTKLQKMFNVKNYHIDQPIILADVRNAIYAVQGIVSVDRVDFDNVINNVNNRTYSDVMFDVSTNTTKGMIIPPPGGIFEIKYPEVDIVGKVV